MKISEVILIRIWLPKKCDKLDIFGKCEFLAITLEFNKLHPNICHQIKEGITLLQNKIYL